MNLSTIQKEDGMESTIWHELLIQRMLHMAPAEGYWDTLDPGVKLYRLDQPTDHGHIVYEPALCVIVQGAKHIKVGEKSLSYDSEHVLFAGIPSPAEVEVIRTEDGPFLGFMIELQMEQISRITLDLLDSGFVVEEAAESIAGGLFVVPMTDDLRGALYRLLTNVAEPMRFRVLYESSLQEVLFHLLATPGADQIFHFVRQDTESARIIGSARYIDQHFSQSLNVSTLSSMAGMSESSYYDKFRKITSLSPMQYVKRIRLHRARQLIASAAGVTEAALTVGYNSPSQFSRDFRKTFGLSPSAFQQSYVGEQGEAS